MLPTGTTDETRRRLILWLCAVGILTSVFLGAFWVAPDINQIRGAVSAGMPVVIVEPSLAGGLFGLSCAVYLSLFVLLLRPGGRLQANPLLLPALIFVSVLLMGLLLRGAPAIANNYARSFGYERCQTLDQFRYEAHSRSGNHAVVAEAWTLPRACKPAT
jgi:hypothetical protein